MIQLNGIKPQVYLDTSMNKAPVKLPENNYRGNSRTDFAINKYNDHKVILFGRNTHLKDISFFELLLKQQNITPEKLVTKTLKAKKLLGQGKEAEVFEIPIKGFQNFLLRRSHWDKSKKIEDFKLKTPKNPFSENENISSVIATIGPYQIINKISGKGLDSPLNFVRDNFELKYRICLAYESGDPFYFNEIIMDLQGTNKHTPSEKKQLQAYNNFKNGYINQLKTIAELPISSYQKMFKDIKLIYDEGFGIDFSLSNLFYNDKTKQIGFIDLENDPDRDFCLCKYMESILAAPLFQYIDFESQKIAKTHCKEIIEKLEKVTANTELFDQGALNSIKYTVGIKRNW